VHAAGRPVPLDRFVRLTHRRPACRTAIARPPADALTVNLPCAPSD
jgi:hypothetical protein